MWAIQQHGFEAVISPRFGDIFRNNSTKNGLVPVVVSAELGTRLLAEVEADPTLELVVDVERRVLEVPALGIAEPFPLDDSVRHRFLEGLDDIGITLQHEADITTFEATRPAGSHGLTLANRGHGRSAGQVGHLGVVEPGVHQGADLVAADLLGEGHEVGGVHRRRRRCARPTSGGWSKKSSSPTVSRRACRARAPRRRRWCGRGPRRRGRPAATGSSPWSDWWARLRPSSRRELPPAWSTHSHSA